MRYFEDDSQMESSGYSDSYSDSEESDSLYTFEDNRTEYLDCCIQVLKKGDMVSLDTVLTICSNVSLLFSMEPTLLRLEGCVNCVGDVHGQLTDLLNVLAVGGKPSESNGYLFMGDYVDRGARSVEVVLLLFALKLRYPTAVWLLRGNHEEDLINSIYGFMDNCVEKWGDKDMWHMFNRIFTFLPVAAVIADRAFCVHGGLSPEIPYIEMIEKANRFTKSGRVPLFLRDLLWSDPSDDIENFKKSKRGCGYFWGERATECFLNMNHLDVIIRAHEVVMEGYNVQHGERVLTIFSASNYCNRYGNKAAMLNISDDFEFNMVVLETR